MLCPQPLVRKGDFNGSDVVWALWTYHSNLLLVELHQH